MQEYPDLRLRLHNSGDIEFSTLFTNQSLNSISNIEAMDKLRAKSEDGDALKGYHDQLHALLSVQVQAIEQLIAL